MEMRRNGTSWAFASSTMPSPTSSCSLATSASCSRISTGLRDALFLGGSKFSSWIEGWGLDASCISGDKIVYRPKELISTARNFRGKGGRVCTPHWLF